MASQIRVDQITNVDGSGAPELTYGATLPEGSQFEVNSNINISGIATVGFLTATNMTVGVLTASQFIGDGSELTGLPTLGESKAIALAYIQ
jgi:hypothetical protein